MVVTRVLALVVGLALSIGFGSSARAGSFDCGSGGDLCNWSIAVDGNLEMQGLYQVDPDTGDINFQGNPTMVDLGGGLTAGVTSVSGNADPILGFGVAAATGGTGSTFVFNFNLPIALSGLIDADSSISYSLSSLSTAGATIAPFLGSNILIASEVDTNGILVALNKGVDTGSAFSVAAGPPSTANSPVFTAVNQITGDLGYDVMAVTVAFSLSANSSTGGSGFVQQKEVPEPAALTLLVVGVVAIVARRRIA